METLNAAINEYRCRNVLNASFFIGDVVREDANMKELVYYRPLSSFSCLKQRQLVCGVAVITAIVVFAPER